MLFVGSSLGCWGWFCVRREINDEGGFGLGREGDFLGLFSLTFCVCFFRLRLNYFFLLFLFSFYVRLRVHLMKFEGFFGAIHAHRFLRCRVDLMGRIGGWSWLDVWVIWSRCCWFHRILLRFFIWCLRDFWLWKGRGRGLVSRLKFLGPRYRFYSRIVFRRPFMVPCIRRFHRKLIFFG